MKLIEHDVSRGVILSVTVLGAAKVNTIPLVSKPLVITIDLLALDLSSVLLTADTTSDLPWPLVTITDGLLDFVELPKFETKQAAAAAILLSAAVDSLLLKAGMTEGFSLTGESFLGCRIVCTGLENENMLCVFFVSFSSMPTLSVPNENFGSLATVVNGLVRPNIGGISLFSVDLLSAYINRKL